MKVQWKARWKAGRLAAHGPCEVLRPLIDMLYPPQCYVCARGLARHGLCNSCRLPAIDTQQGSRCDACYLPLSGTSADGASLCEICLRSPLMQQRLRYAWYYQDAVREFMRCLKYRRHARLLPLLCNTLATNVDLFFPGEHWDLLVPIPPSYSSRHTRLFSVPYAIAHTISKQPRYRAIPLALHALHFRKRHRPQVGLSLQQRASNMRGAFRAYEKQVRGRSILLIEDVLTTGATLNAATLALLDAGAARVDVLCAACSSQWERTRREAAGS